MCLNLNHTVDLIHRITALQYRNDYEISKMCSCIMLFFRTSDQTSLDIVIDHGVCYKLLLVEIQAGEPVIKKCDDLIHIQAHIRQFVPFWKYKSVHGYNITSFSITFNMVFITMYIDFRCFLY